MATATASSKKLKPLGDRVVIQPTPREDVTKSGIVLPDTAKEKPQEAEVVAIGPGKRLESGTLVPLDVKVGDRILLGKYAGNEIKLDGQEYLIVREDEVLGIVGAPTKLAKAS